MEPVTTILGLISFATGMLAFLTTGIETIVVQGDLALNVSEQLSGYSRRVRRSQAKLLQWRTLWCDKYDFTIRRDVFEYIWGQDGYKEIAVIFEAIQDLSSRICRVLSVQSSTDSERTRELNTWRIMVNDVQNDQRRIGPFRKFREVYDKWTRIVDVEKVLKGVKMVLGQDKVLRKCIEDLENETDALESLSHVLYANLQLNHTLRIRSAEDITTLQQAREFLDSFHSFANDLHAHLETTQGNQEWHIELRIIDLYELVENLKDIAQIDIDFTVLWRSTSKSHPQLRRRKLVFQLGNLNADETFRALENSLEALEDEHHVEIRRGCVQMLFPNPLNRSLSLKERLLKVHKDIRQYCENDNLGSEITAIEEAIRNEKIKMRKGWEVDRATIALGLVNWNLTLWQTRWFSLPCTCGVRRTNLEPADWRYTFYSERVRHDGGCQGSELPEDPLRLLGTMLAEIAILEPLVLQLDSEGEVFFRCLDRSLSRRELLDSVCKCTNMLYKNAVGYCLDWRRYDAKRRLRPEDLYTYREKILVPIRSYYEVVVEKHREKPDKRNWRQSLNRAVVWPSEQSLVAGDI